MIYFQIPIDDFVSGRNCQFNICVRKKDNSYHLIFSIGDVFDPMILKEYSSKGHKFLYIPMADKSRYQSFCSHLAKKAVSVEFKSWSCLTLFHEFFLKTSSWFERVVALQAGAPFP